MDIIDIKNNLINEIEKLIKIIQNEYPNLVDIPIDYNLQELIHIEATGTLSLFVRDKKFYFPLDAFKVLETLKKIPGFGKVPNHTTCTKDNMIINDNTYATYIKHVFLKGLTPEEYFKEILLHETLHFAGSGGGTAIREGINELKTRQLAKKYGLLTSACGYPKETKIAYELEEIFGASIINKIAFSKNPLEIKETLDSVSPEATEFFFNLERIMEKEFYNKYMKYDFPGLTGPLKKTQKYNSIDYTEAYKLIDKYKNRIQISLPVDTSFSKDKNILVKPIEQQKQEILEEKEILTKKMILVGMNDAMISTNEKPIIGTQSLATCLGVLLYSEDKKIAIVAHVVPDKLDAMDKIFDIILQNKLLNVNFKYLIIPGYYQEHYQTKERIEKYLKHFTPFDDSKITKQSIKTNDKLPCRDFAFDAQQGVFVTDKVYFGQDYHKINEQQLEENKNSKRPR